jgi:UDP-N-acetylmuramyl pentapeptide phosphotransferase/UDP-N-acetylglucosamine-1-phosphate transferase
MSIILISLFFFLVSFAIAYIVLPKIRTIAKVRSFHSLPNERTSHENAIPNVGGVAFYVCLMLSFHFIFPFDKYQIINSVIPGLTILFIIGLKDDLVLVSSSTKLIAQIVAALFLIFDNAFHLTDLHGLFYLEKIHFFASSFFTLFMVVSIINSFNLIDGIDGLAGFISIIIFSSFSVISFIIDDKTLFLISIVALGAVIAFLRFNFSERYKIFMGDTGSLILGFIIALIVLRFFAIEESSLLRMKLPLQNWSFLLLAILSVPLIDTSRVFLMRIYNGKSPFEADRNHIHHVILDYYNLSHFKVSLILAIMNIVIIAAFIPLVYLTNQWICLTFTFLLFGVSILVVNQLKSKSQNKTNLTNEKK